MYSYNLIIIWKRITNLKNISLSKIKLNTLSKQMENSNISTKKQFYDKTKSEKDVQNNVTYKFFIAHAGLIKDYQNKSSQAYYGEYDLHPEKKIPNYHIPNSILAIYNSIKCPFVNMIEIDVRMTFDNICVLAHDDYDPDSKHVIENTYFQHLKGIAKLSSALTLINVYKKYVLIDIKHNYRNHIEDYKVKRFEYIYQILECILNSGIDSSMVYLASFDYQDIAVIYKLMNTNHFKSLKCKRGFIFYNIPESFEKMLCNIWIDFVVLNIDYINSKALQIIKFLEMPYFVYTLEYPHQVKWLKSLYPNHPTGIITEVVAIK